MNEVAEAPRAAERAHKSTTHEEMYFHIRVPTEWNGKHVVAGTVFYRKEERGEWWFSLARCSSGDQFSREVGRNIARRRYFGRDANIYYHGLEKPTYEDALENYQDEGI